MKDQQYNIFFMTRNGGFTELDRLHRLDDGHWSEAVVVSATYYYDDKIVRVMDEADAFFPPAILASDPDVTRFRKWPLIKVELSPLLKGPS